MGGWWRSWFHVHEYRESMVIDARDWNDCRASVLLARQFAGSEDWWYARDHFHWLRRLASLCIPVAWQQTGSAPGTCQSQRRHVYASAHRSGPAALADVRHPRLLQELAAFVNLQRPCDVHSEVDWAGPELLDASADDLRPRGWPEQCSDALGYSTLTVKSPTVAGLPSVGGGVRLGAQHRLSRDLWPLAPLVAHMPRTIFLLTF